MLPPVQVLRVPRSNVKILVNQSRNLMKRPKSIIPSRSSQSVLPPYNHITQIGDPVLRVQCDPLDPKDIQSKEIQSVISSMKFTLKRYDCVGVSAPQVGVPAQLMMVKFTSSQLKFWSEDIQNLREMEEIPYRILINPKLQVLDKSQVKRMKLAVSTRNVCLRFLFQKVVPACMDLVLKVELFKNKFLFMIFSQFQDTRRSRYPG